MVLLVSAVPHALAAEADVGGNLNNPGPTKAQIAAKWNEVTGAATVYTKEPSVFAPYATGELSQDFLQSGITYLNYIRYVANLPQVQLDSKLNENAQYGAVLLAALNTLTHYPDRPADMDQRFYQQGYSATTSSNISAHYGSALRSSLQKAISECMADNSSSSNLACVGHRRWLLNPTLLNVGFGCATSDSGWNFVDTKVFDRSGEGCDYQFISWPASGNHPTNLFNTNNPWSVTLNPQIYQAPQLSNVKVTLTREADQKQWTFDASTGDAEYSAQPYLAVDNNGYGVSNCIIFHPGASNVGSYEGVYTVEITGLFLKSGEAAQLRYQVDFFDVNKVATQTTGGILQKVDGQWKYYVDGAYLPVTTLVKHSGSWYYVKNGVVDFDFAGFVYYNGSQFYVKNGKVASATTGLVKSNGVWFYIVNGKLADTTTNLVKYNGEWFYVVNGLVATDITSLVKYNGEWFYVYKGKMAGNTTTLMKYNGGWYYIYKGKLAAKTTTLVKYSGAWYYVENGKVNFSYTGTFRFNGGLYQIVNGKKK